jgi:hypothetical protein
LLVVVSSLGAIGAAPLAMDIPQFIDGFGIVLITRHGQKFIAAKRTRLA